jgi:FMN phosphatase YigB (HAD superfamily)
MIRAAIFDLDNCLSAADEPGREIHAPVFDAIRQANQGTLSEDALQAAFADYWRHAFDFVARKHRFSEAMRKAGWEAACRVEVRRPMRGYADLGALAELPVRRFLVTTGFRRLQASKIRALGIASLFESVHIDAIDEADRKGKQGLFAELLAAHGFAPDEVLVIGDNPDSEIEAGNRLGMTTVQILRKGVPFTRKAAHHICTLAELSRFLR